MERNKSKFFYALYKEKVPKTDEYGNVTGEYEIIRDNPVEFSANISAAKGETSTRQFGESESYDKVIVMGTDAPPIDEYTVLWVDKTPQVDETGALVTNDDGEVITPHDYIVKKMEALGFTRTLREEGSYQRNLLPHDEQGGAYR